MKPPSPSIVPRCHFAIKLIIVLSVASVPGVSSDNGRFRRDDSYLSAYKQTHNLNNHLDGTANVVYVDPNQPEDVHPVYVQNQIDDSNPHPSVEHTHHYDPEYHQHFEEVSTDSAPSSLGNYGVSSYDPSASQNFGRYPSPVLSYGPPAATYPPKEPAYAYGPPSPVYVPQSFPPQGHVTPHHKFPPLINHGYYDPDPPIIPKFLQDLVTPDLFLSILDKIKWFKVDLFTIGKLVLKFVIFKKILAFLTILFLLLVIPSLKHKGKESLGMMTAMVDKFGVGGEEDDDDDEERRKGRMFPMNKDRINKLTSHVLSSIESFEEKFVPKATIIATDLQPTNLTNCSDGKHASSNYCKSQSVIEKIKTMIPPRETKNNKRTNEQSDDTETRSKTFIKTIK